MFDTSKPDTRPQWEKDLDLAPTAEEWAADQADLERRDEEKHRFDPAYGG